MLRHSILIILVALLMLSACNSESKQTTANAELQQETPAINKDNKDAIESDLN
jgi:uncharacterized lipoprotein YajG